MMLRSKHFFYVFYASLSKFASLRYMIVSGILQLTALLDVHFRQDTAITPDCLLPVIFSNAGPFRETVVFLLLAEVMM